MKRDAVTHIMSTYRDSHSLNMMMMRMPRNSSYHVSPNRLHTVGSHSLPLRCIPFAYDLQPRALLWFMLGGVITSSRFSKATRPQNKKYLTSIPLKGDFIMYTAAVSKKIPP